MENQKLKRSLENLERALDRLDEALQEDDTNSLIVDATIQRFEFTIELFWKALKRALFEEGIEAKTPKEALREAYQAGWLNDEKAWLQMLKDRNETSRTYDEEKALEIVGHIKWYYPEFVRTFDFLKQRFDFNDSE
ncbi:nucleotidyltransferase substrate binding protein [Halobacillus litoralis]|uniref:HI0074 family nucleotidyltransferase substrate-binding subunit n=1 Tax=Halobacillus litoralis TaxID=45668 RepID=UPI001CD1C04C|nr:HI0074 family nucleotidyltransferase substrate-binding subunit [Halobacillus litoralis]MCA0972218.1 nucleotidyltransferase substrate binding protein [Halobacillus litoralis]